MGLNVGGVQILAGASDQLYIGDGSVNWLSIDAQGRQRTPQRPAFQGQFGAQGSRYQASAAKPSVVFINQGNCYNASTGIFTTPVGGRYLIGCNLLACGVSEGSAANGYFGLVRNGGLQVFSHWNIQTWHEYVGLSAVLECNAGDQLTWAINVAPAPVGTTLANVYGGGGHSSFYCVLVG